MFTSIQQKDDKKKKGFIEVKIIKIKKFMEFENKNKNFTIWKLWLSDFKTISVFFSDENPNIEELKIFRISKLDFKFYRGKRNFVFGKLSSCDQIFKFNIPVNKFQSNLSLTEHKII